MRLFITGGTGFIGRHLLDYWLQHAPVNAQAVVMCRQPALFREQFPRYAQAHQLSFVQGDLLGAWPTVHEPFTHVIHAAADTHSQGSARAWVAQIVQGTLNLLDFAKLTGAKRVLLLSSGAVYGPQPDHLEKIPEDYTGAPPTHWTSSVYGQAKRLSEQLAFDCSTRGEFEVVVARIFALSGRHLPLNGPYALGNFIRDALARQPIHIAGDGRAMRSYLDGDDLAHWLMTLLNRGESGQAYNVGSERAISIADLAAVVRDTLCPGLAVNIAGHGSSDNAHRSVYIPDTSKARGLGLGEGIALTESILKRVSNRK